MGTWAVSDAARLVPAYTAATLAREYPDQAAPWLAGFADRVDALAAQWTLRLDRCVGGARACCVLGVDAADRPVAVKVAPDDNMMAREVAALVRWQASGVVPDIYDVASGAALYEQIVPGTPAGRPADHPAHHPAGGAATAPTAVVNVLARLAGAAGPGHSDSGGPEAGEGRDNLGRELHRRYSQAAARVGQYASWHGLGPLADWARARAMDLHAEALGAGPSFVHGDFQPKNLLAGPQGWVVIDPLPGLGDPCVDAALWAVCDIASPPIAETITVLGDQLSLPAARVAQWATVLSVSEYRPERRWHLSARIAAYLDTVGAGDAGIDDRDARQAWATRSRPHLIDGEPCL